MIAIYGRREIQLVYTLFYRRVLNVMYFYNRNNWKIYKLNQ